jgi:hypothetical protein
VPTTGVADCLAAGPVKADVVRCPPVAEFLAACGQLPDERDESRNLSEKTGQAFGEQEDLRILGGTPARPPFGLFDWYQTAP